MARVGGTSLSLLLVALLTCSARDCTMVDQAEPAIADAHQLSEISTTLPGFDLPPGMGSTKPLWFTLSVPSGEDQFIPPGDYQGQLALSAVPDAG